MARVSLLCRKSASRAALDIPNGGRGLLQSVIGDYTWADEDVDVDVLGANINVYARLSANDSGFMAMAFGDVLDYNFDFHVSADYMMESSSYAPDQLFDFLRNEGVHNPAEYWNDPYRQFSEFDNYFFQVRSCC